MEFLRLIGVGCNLVLVVRRSEVKKISITKTSKDDEYPALFRGVVVLADGTESVWDIDVFGLGRLEEDTKDGETE